ncbi:Cation efflux transmembrane domain superfamily [Fusarium oxysporum f. sp. vasinfectum]|nr:Cation efflux transmembrane domain superfamily [Fusarium oxysporum f. sp. vasinfectum]KAK2925408.1 Cation efflux transmembrane domain superfamily [Fusarium oxysporum f. sp. vasinfectum]
MSRQVPDAAYNRKAPMPTVEPVYSYPLKNVPGFSVVALRVTYPPGAEHPPHRHGGASLLRIEIVTVMLSAALLIGLSIAIVIDAVSQFIDLEPMTEPFVIFVTGASCLALNLVSRVLMQPRCPVGSGMGMGRSTSEGPSLGTNRMRNRQVDESGQLGNQTFPSSTISGQNGNDQDMDESKITNRRMGGFLRSLSRVRDYLRSWNAPIITLWNRLLSADPQAVSLRSKTVSLWDSSNALGDICITLAALLVWKVPVASIQYIDPTLAMCIALLSMYFAYRLILAASAILLQATPSTIDTNIIKEAVERIDGVLSAHHVHIFALNESKLICSMHVQVLSRATSGERFMEVMRQIRRILHTYGVHSATIQPEYSLDENDSIPFLKAEQTEGENWQRPLSLGNKSKSF